MTELPAPVAEAFDATNAGDLERFVAAFADDGVIDDWGREFRGHEEIAGWSRRESIGVHQTFDGSSFQTPKRSRKYCRATPTGRKPALQKQAIAVSFSTSGSATRR